MRSLRGIGSPLQGIVAVLTASLILWAAGCQHDTTIGPTDPLLSESIISDPAPSISLSTNRAAFALVPDAYAAYISVPRDSLPRAAGVTIRNPRTDISIEVTVVEGGFDPVPIKATEGDVLGVTIHSANGSPDEQMSLVVPKVRRPTIVRTDPPKGKRDVQLNSAVLMVFSEPIDDRTVTASSVQLQLDGTSVVGRLEFRDADHLTLAFVPDEPLEGSTAYEIVVSDAVRDLDGEALERALRSEFTTDASPVGSIRITTTTSGQDVDQNGYSVVLEGSTAPPQAIGTSGSVLLEAVRIGNRSVSLTEVAANCTVAAPNPAVVSVETNAIATAAFVISCTKMTGTIRVSTVTSGEDFPPQYSIQLDAITATATIGTSGTVDLPDVPIGSHSVRLTGVPTNCTIAAPHPVTVAVQWNAVVTANFAVVCAKATGSIQVKTVTSGEELPTGDYTFWIDGSNSRTIGPNGTVIVPNLAIGNHSVSLSRPSNCAIVEPEPVTVTVEINSTTSVNFTIVCRLVTGSIRVTTATTGVDIDSDGYAVVMGGDAGNGDIAPAIGINGSITISRVPEGQQYVSLANVAENCAVSGTQPRSVLVTAGATTEITFEVQCSALAAVRITATTTGVDLPSSGYIAQLQRLGSLQELELPLNGSATSVELLFTDVVITLSGVSANCDVLGANPLVVPIISGMTTEVTFSVTCLPATWIAFSGFMQPFGNQEDIYIIKSNGSAQTRLTTSVATDADPDWSPDGSRITFRSHRDGNAEIYIMSSDGSGQSRLTSNAAADREPVWSPDGSRIAFVSERDGNPEIYLMNSDGSNPIRLTTNAGSDGSPSWSPDGNRIAFRSDRIATQPGNGEIFAMNADGSNVVRLTYDLADDATPAWSPDGSRIAFARFIACESQFGESLCQSDIFTVNADGTSLSRVSSINWGLYSDDEKAPSWSPDGRKLAISRTTCVFDGDCHISNMVTIITLGTPGHRDLVGSAFYPAWRR